MAEEEKEDLLGDGLMDIFSDTEDEESDLAGLTMDLEDVDMSDLLSLARQVLSELQTRRAEAEL